MSREQELSEQGWVKRATYDEPRLTEMVELYKELGFDVHVEPFEPADESSCAECMKLAPNRFATIYTRNH